MFSRLVHRYRVARVSERFGIQMVYHHVIWITNYPQIATPGHELYGQFLSQEVINSMIAPKDESRDLVMEWLASEGMSDVASLSAQSDSVIVEASLTQVEKLLNAEYSAFGMLSFLSTFP